VRAAGQNLFKLHQVFQHRWLVKVGIVSPTLEFARFHKRNNNRYTQSTYLINIRFLAKLGHFVFNFLSPKEYEYQGYSRSYGSS
jgi:hypothetical protein